MMLKRYRNVYSIIFSFSVCIFILISCNPDRQKKEYTVKFPKTAKEDSTAYRKVRLQLQWLHQSQFAGFYAALDKGYYRDYGLDVEIIMGGPNLASADELYAGNAEFSTMFLASALRQIDEGRDIINIAQLSQKSSLLLVALKSSGITSIKDMNHKRIGLWAKDFYHPSIIFLNKNKISAQIVPISWTVNVLTEKVVDVMNMMEYNEYDIFISSGYKPEDLTVFPLSEYGVNIPEDGIYCRKDYYLEHESLCHDFAEASMDGWFFALNHEEETLEIVLKNLKQAHLPANIPHQKWMLQKIRESMLYKPEQFGKLTEHDYNSSVKMMKQNNIISKSLPYKQFIGYAAQD